MCKLIFIKHSKPQVDEHSSHRTSGSSPTRAAPVAMLVQKVRPYEPAIIIASEEPKAAETGASL